VKIFQWPVRIYYEDTDSGGVVYHTNYLKFMERARTEQFRSYGIEQDKLIKEDEIIFAVRSLNVDYLKPAHFNDLLEVSSRVSQVGKASLVFKQGISRSADDTLLCEAEVKVACLSVDGLRPCAIPSHIMNEIKL